jgi:tripartite-type tricarboxylate transporter receptor subunit TctC
MDRRHFVTGSLALASSAISHAQNATSNNLIPKGPVRIIVGFPPGGGTDALARVLAQKLEAIWGVSILIDNRPGAAGVIAADYVSKQPPDGNVLLMGHINSHALAPALGAKLNYDADQDFTPLAMVGITPNVLICNTTQPAKSVSELVALCKRLPGQISFASAGGGSAQHFALEMFKLQAKIDAIHVPYKGTSPALADLMGGSVQIMTDTPSALMPFVRSGKIKALAMFSLKRVKGAEEVPTIVEAGGPPIEGSTWVLFLGQNGVPKEIVTRLSNEIAKAVHSTEITTKFEELSIEPIGNTPYEAGKFLDDEIIKWSKVINTAGVKAEQ